MLDLRSWFYLIQEENDIDDLKYPYKLMGQNDRQNITQKYMQIEYNEKGVFVYPGIASLLT